MLNPSSYTWEDITAGEWNSILKCIEKFPLEEWATFRKMITENPKANSPDTDTLDVYWKNLAHDLPQLSKAVLLNIWIHLLQEISNDVNSTDRKNNRDHCDTSIFTD